MNIGECKIKAIKLINFYSVSGNLISSSDPAYLDYVNRMNDIIDTCQKEIATTAKRIRKQYKISQNPIQSQLSYDNPFDIQQHLNEDITTDSATASRAYTFKVDNVADVYIEESIDDGETWFTNQSINHLTPTGQFTEYKGLITLSTDTSLIRIRFAGNYVYNFRDVALFEYTFPNSASIPQYTNYNLYTMPTGFYKLNKVTLKGNSTEGNKYYYPAYYWEKNNVLAINYYISGEYVIDYYAYPTTVNDSSSDSDELEIDIEAQEAIPYYVAAHLMMDENGNINNKLYAMYQGKLANLDDDIDNGMKSITNTLFSNEGTNKLFSEGCKWRS